MELSDALEKITSGIDPGTLRLVAQCLNHYATPGLPIYLLLLEMIMAYFRKLQQHFASKIKTTLPFHFLLLSFCKLSSILQLLQIINSPITMM